MFHPAVQAWFDERFPDGPTPPQAQGWVHIAASYYYDVAPCLKKKVPVIWVNRSHDALETGQKKPDAEVPSLREAAKLIAAS